MKIINLSEKFKGQDPNPWKILDGSLIFYIRDKNNSLRIYAYDLKSDEIKELKYIENLGDSSEEYIALEYIEGDNFYYSMEEDGEISYYEYGDEKRLLVRTSLDSLEILDENYGLASSYKGQLELLDLKTGSRLDFSLEAKGEYIGSQLKEIGGRDYIFFSYNNVYDAYDFFQAYEEGRRDLESIIYYMELDQILEEAGQTKRLRPEILGKKRNSLYLENLSYQYYDIYREEKTSPYYFTRLDLEKRDYSLYRLREDFSLDKIWTYEGAFSPDEIYGLYFYRNPLRIHNHRVHYGTYSCSVYYPEEFNYRGIFENEHYEGLIGDSIISLNWEEDPDYRNYLNIIDRSSLSPRERYEIAEGLGLVVPEENLIII